MSNQTNGSTLPKANEREIALQAIIDSNKAAQAALTAQNIHAPASLQVAIDAAEVEMSQIRLGKDVVKATEEIKPQLGLLDWTNVPDGNWIANVQVAGGKLVDEATKISSNRVLTNQAPSKKGVVGAGQVVVNGHNYGSITEAVKVLFPDKFKEGQSKNYRPVLIAEADNRQWSYTLPEAVTRS